MAHRKNARFYLNLVIGLSLMFFFPLINPIGPITSVGMSVLGIFLGMIWLWISVDGMWPSLLALLLIGLCGYVPDAPGHAGVKSVFASAFGNETVLIVVFFMVFLSAVGGVGLPSHIARFLLKRKFLEGKPYLLLYMMVFCSYTLAGLADVMIALFILWPIAQEICNKCNYEKGSRFYYTIMCSVFFGAAIGQPLLPFKGMTAGLMETFRQSMGQSINLGSWLVFNVIMAVLLFFCYILMIRFFIRPDVSAIKNLTCEDIVSGSNEKMNTAQKVVAIELLCIILFVLAQNLLPATVPGIKFLKSLGVVGILIVMISIAMCLKNSEGKPVINLRTFCKKSFNFNMYFQVTAAVYLANALTDNSTGIKIALVDIMEPILGGVHPLMFVALIILLTIIATNVANNMIVGVIMLTLLSAFYSTMDGLNAVAVGALIIMSCVVAMLLPSGSVYSSMLHARSDLVSFKEIQIVFIPTIIVTAVLYFAVGYPLAQIIF